MAVAVADDPRGAAEREVNDPAGMDLQLIQEAVRQSRFTFVDHAVRRMAKRVITVMEVREAILDTAWTLAAGQGPASVTMSAIAERAGIGRATLYKYFPDVQSILVAWHHRQIGRHLLHLAEVRDKAIDPEQRLQAVLEAYAHIHQQRTRHHRDGPHGAELATLLHRDDQVAPADAAGAGARKPRRWEEV